MHAYSRSDGPMTGCSVSNLNLLNHCFVSSFHINYSADSSSNQLALYQQQSLESQVHKALVSMAESLSKIQIASRSG